ncbi:MAG: 1,4-alpha-glucan branching protein GlgB [Bacteroidota bacterium]|nr:1,4-alpha-glucan branching protein GlgB [Bacteroidota bacterium]MDW8138650.1 1,4-alpha-glucan branching protein GlgB [Bacteroidota bacterium]MDW8284764.1 1,4-alpha-glucan branching protein GlgB [Bacteroidota bacterium]
MHPDPALIEALFEARHGDPFAILGPQRDESGWVVRAFWPSARRMWLLTGSGELIEPAYVPAPGCFLFRWPGPDRPRAQEYTLRIAEQTGPIWETYDPYAFGPVLGELDRYLLAEGRHWRLYERLGAHCLEHEGVRGVHFAVWAPNAERVSVVGDWNAWDGRRHVMRLHPGCGVWEIFIPGLGPGARYKYEIRTRSGEILLKADPVAFYAEQRPATASIVYAPSYTWSDEAWMRRRAQGHRFDEPLLIYEVHLGSWRRVPEEGDRWLSYRELAEWLIPYAVEMGFTHLELLPIMEHPLDTSWGYQVTGYFAPTSRYGEPDELRYLIDCCHQAGLGVILDWVPAHFPTDAHGLYRFDGTHLYEHADPRQGYHPDWHTAIFNYGRYEVRNFLIANALFWAEAYHIDGLRVDAVASMLYLDYSRREGEWVPNSYGGRENLEAIAFLRELSEVLHAQHPGVILIAEESTAWPMVSRPTYVGGLGFDYKWNMGWMHDTRRYFSRDPVYRKYHQHELTFSMLYAFSEQYVLPFSHDEVVHGKGSLVGRMPGDRWQRFANMRAMLAYQYAHPGKKLLFMGQEFAQEREWDYRRSLDWHLLEDPLHRGVQRLVRDLNRLLRQEPALHAVDFDWSGFEWVDFHDADQSVLAFLRRAGSEHILVVLNLTPVPRYDYRVGVPIPGFYRELLNTDSAYYGGTNMGNLGGLWAEPVPYHGRPHSLRLLLPPLAALFLKPEPAA